jgi:hypothetical protein
MALKNERQAEREREGRWGETFIYVNVLLKEIYFDGINQTVQVLSLVFQGVLVFSSRAHSLAHNKTGR